jgi:serine/threonine-protein kinase
MLALTVPTFVVYFATLLVSSPMPADGPPRSLFADMLIALGLLGFAAVGGELLWRSRRHIAEVRRLGRYRLDTLLERDAMSETWRAHDTTSGVDVALELYRARPLGDPAHAQALRATGELEDHRLLDDERRERFVEAANAVAALRSPVVMRVFDCGANDDGIAFIARDFIAGERLDSLVRRAGPLEAHRAISLARMLATALTEAHRKGVAHRDLRPWNVFVAPDHEGRDIVRLIGWGLPDLVRSPEARDALLIGRGPGLFHAPEWPVGSGVRGDVYGLGALLFWGLTGHPPVELRAGEAPWRAHARSVVQRPSTLRGELLPAGLDALVLSCLERDPLARPADASKVLELLDALPVPR